MKATPSRRKSALRAPKAKREGNRLPARVSSLRDWLGEGDLRSDGLANQVAELLGQRPDLLPDLIDALTSEDPAARGHAADALEKVARTQPREVMAFLPILIRAAQHDPVGMVRWHIAMTLGHLAIFPESIPKALDALIGLLSDRNALVRSWAVTSLCIISRLYPEQTEVVVDAATPLVRDRSAAVSKRARRALELMTIPALAFPKGWIKSGHIHSL